MNKHTRYFHYSDITVHDHLSDMGDIHFDNVAEAGKWFYDHGLAASENAARTGVYYLLEGRMKHYRYFWIVGYTAVAVRF